MIVANPKGLISLCADPANNVMAIPGLQKGWIHIELYNISKATLIKVTLLLTRCISHECFEIIPTSREWCILIISVVLGEEYKQPLTIHLRLLFGP